MIPSMSQQSTANSSTGPITFGAVNIASNSTTAKTNWTMIIIGSVLGVLALIFLFRKK